jgi:outer membrane protein W
MTPRLLALTLLALLVFPAFAQQPRNELAASFGRSEFDQLGDAPAVGLSYNRFWTRMVSTRFGAFVASEDLNEDGGNKRVGAYHASVEVHFLRERVLSPFVSVGGALAFSRVEHPNSDFTASDSLLTPIVGAGIDITITPHFALGADAHYIKYDAETDLGDRFGTTLDPLTVLVSAKYRF